MSRVLLARLWHASPLHGENIEMLDCGTDRRDDVRSDWLGQLAEQAAPQRG